MVELCVISNVAWLLLRWFTMVDRFNSNWRMVGSWTNIILGYCRPQCSTFGKQLFFGCFCSYRILLGLFVPSKFNVWANAALDIADVQRHNQIFNDIFGCFLRVHTRRAKSLLVQQKFAARVYSREQHSTWNRRQTFYVSKSFPVFGVFPIFDLYSTMSLSNQMVEFIPCAYNFFGEYHAIEIS